MKLAQKGEHHLHHLQLPLYHHLLFGFVSRMGFKFGAGVEVRAVANIGRTNFLNRFKVDGNKLRGNFSLARVATTSSLLFYCPPRPTSPLLNFMKTWHRNFNSIGVLEVKKTKIKLPFNDITKTQPQRSF